jgi:hypothetical protein
MHRLRHGTPGRTERKPGWRWVLPVLCALVIGFYAGARGGYYQGYADAGVSNG